MTLSWPFAPLRPLSYGAILADPPWSFENWSPAGEGRNAKRHYPCMRTADIAALPAGHLASGDAALFLWVCNPLLPDGMRVMSAWGFRYVTVAFIWAKRTRRDTGWHMGNGYWTRANSELCLLGTTGSPRRLSAAVRELVIAPLQEHSRKPDKVHESIEALVPGPRVELFARRRRPGWDCWGNELEETQP